MDHEWERLAKSIAVRCVRRGFLETGLHRGTFPGSKTDDYTDVKVVSPYGEIPWNELNRISEEEMKRLMKSVVNKIYTVLVNLDNPEFMATLHKWSDRRTYKWDKPELVPDLLKGADIDAPGFIDDFNEWYDKRFPAEADKPKSVANIVETAKQPDES